MQFGLKKLWPNLFVGVHHLSRVQRDTERWREQTTESSGETSIPRMQPNSESINHMGDRSPKDNQKKTGQKQAKASSSDQKKKAQVAAKAANTGKKK
jgi:hypothetical protein